MSEQPALFDDAADSLVGDFLGEWDDAVREVEAQLLQLEASPHNETALHALFRSLHSMKSNLRMMRYDAAADLMHSLEDVLDDLRHGRLAFDAVFADLILLLVNRLRSGFACWVRGASDPEVRLDQLAPLLRTMRTNQAAARTAARQAVALLDPSWAAADPGAGADHDADLALFRRLAQASEGRAHLEPGCCGRIEQLVLQLNRLAGSPVNEQQLIAAAALHDVGMAMLPSQMLDKADGLSSEEARLLHPHPQLGADLLAQMPHWAEARQMVLQHHEWVDGSGYPQGLRAEAIHAGAKLLAIADTYEAMTQKRAYRDLPRPVLRAVAEINSRVGSQFDRGWVHVFNRWVRQQFVARRD